MSNDRKYELTGETRVVAGRKLHRIRAVRSFNLVVNGQLGGWIETEKNLSHYGDCWVYDEACVYDTAFVSDNACIFYDAQVFCNAKVCENARVYGDARICDDAVVCDSAVVYGGACVCGDAVCTITPIVITGLHYRVTITDKHIQIGCQQYTASQLRKAIPDLMKTYKLSKLERDYLELIIRTSRNRLKSLKKTKK